MLLATNLAGCGPAAEPPPAASRSAPALQPVQQAEHAEITPEKIAGDLVGRKVRVSDTDGANENEWTFEPAEFRRVAIVERKTGDKGETVVVFVTTQNNPEGQEDQIRVSGKLQLTYVRKGADWVLSNIENISFQYTIGVAT